MSMRTPRHDYGPTATPSSYATPRGPMLGSSTNGVNTPGGPLASSSSQPHSFDFLQHPLFKDGQAMDDSLQFEGVYSRMGDFKKLLEDFVVESCHRIDEGKENQDQVKNVQKARIQHLETETEAHKKTQKQLFAAIAAEKEEDNAARRSLLDKERQIHSSSSELTDIQGELEELRRQFALKRAEKSRRASQLTAMGKLDAPERMLLESRTGCRIESPISDVVSFSFTRLDPAHPKAEAYFVLAMDGRTWNLQSMQPTLADSVIQPIIVELNASRNPFTMVKKMRKQLKLEIEKGNRAVGTAEEAMKKLSL